MRGTPRTTGTRSLKRLFSLRSISEATDLPLPSLYTYVAEGRIPVVRIGRSIRVPEDDWEAFIDEHREKGSVR